MSAGEEYCIYIEACICIYVDVHVCMCAGVFLYSNLLYWKCLKLFICFRNVKKKMDIESLS